MRKSQTAKLQLWNVCMNYNYILTNMCACEKFWENFGVLATFPFFRNPPPTIRDPEKKPKKIMHPFSRLAFMNMEKKDFLWDSKKKSLIDVILYFCIFGFFPTILLMY